MSTHEAPADVDGVIVEVGAEPVRVDLGGQAYVVARLGDRVVAAVDRCPHRGAPLSAGTVERGCLVCPYHGWHFGPDGRASLVPALGDGAPIPPKARVPMVECEPLQGRSVLVHQPRNLRLVKDVGPVLANDDPALGKMWHPVCRSGEVLPDGWLVVGLIGLQVLVERHGTDRLSASIAGVPLHAAADHLGHVWVAVEPPLVPLIEVDDLDQEGWQHVPMPRVEGRYGVGLLLDNQLDPGHFSFVHRGTFGSAGDPVIPPYQLERHRWGFDTVFQVPISARNDRAVRRGDRPLGQHRTMTYRYQAPTTVFLRLDYQEMGGSTAILFCFTPVAADRARMDVDLYFRRPGGFTDEELAERLAFECRVLGEDMALQDLFDTTELPLDPTAEVHTRADRAAVEMRRMLSRLLADQV